MSCGKLSHPHSIAPVAVTGNSLFKVRRLVGRISAVMEWWEELDEMEKRTALRSSGFRTDGLHFLQEDPAK